MEHLDSKYFERVIAALKQARDSQTIEINENFRRTLRARIEERALTAMEAAEPSWVEWVLKFRYILGGVPVMAALVLATTAALNHNVPMDGQMLTETGEINGIKATNVLATQDLPVAGKAGLLAETTSRLEEVPTENGLVTFSAELVMPPAGVLAAREAYLKTLEGGSVQLLPISAPETVQTVPSSPAYTFFEGTINSVLNIPMPQAEPSVSAVRVEQIVSPTVSTELISAPSESRGKTAVSSAVVETMPMTGEIQVYNLPAKPSMSPEASGKLTVAEPNEQKTDEQKIMENAQPYSAIDMLTMPVVAPTLPEAYMVVDPAKGTFKKIEVELAQTVEVAPSIVAEPAVEGAKFSSTYDFRSESLVPLAEAGEVDNQPLLAERIYFRGDLRENLVRVVMLALAVRDGNLSRDYYVNIVKFPDNTYRATLYEHGGTRTVLVIALQRDGEYHVITQVDY